MTRNTTTGARAYTRAASPGEGYAIRGKTAHAHRPVSSLDPIIRWPGGKRWLVDQIAGLIPRDFAGRYFEPFFGGGALFFATRPAVATLNDVNAELMACYDAIGRQPRAVEAALRGLPLGQVGYYAVRAHIPVEQAARAARLIYLAAHSFNGIYRVNRQGVFNVPYGGREYELGAEGSLQAHSEALRAADIMSGDFAVAMARASVNAGPNLSRKRRLKTEQVSAPSRRSAPPAACPGVDSSRP